MLLVLTFLLDARFDAGSPLTREMRKVSVRSRDLSSARALPTRHTGTAEGYRGSEGVIALAVARSPRECLGYARKHAPP